MPDSKALVIVLIAVLLGIFMRIDIFTLPIQGKHSWRQTKTAWNIRNFVRHDSNIFNPRQGHFSGESNILRYEFPIMQWSIAMVEKVVGEDILVKRLFVYLISLFSLIAVFKLAFLLSGDKLTAAMSVWVFSFLPTFFYHSVNILPDNLALCFGLFYILFYFRYHKSAKIADLAVAVIFLSLAGLAKLPFILLGTVSLIDFIRMITKRNWRQVTHFAMIHMISVIPVIGWYLMAVPTWKGNNIVTGFARDFVGMDQILEFLRIQVFENFPTQLLNYPSLIFLLFGVYFYVKKRRFFLLEGKYIFAPLGILLLYFLYVLNNIREGHDYYLMPFYTILIVPIIYGIHKLYETKNRGRLVTFILLAAMPIFCWQKTKDNWQIENAYFNSDVFICRDALEAAAPKDALAIVVNDNSKAIFSYVIDNRGFTFYNDHLPVHWIKDIINRRNAQYLFSDSRKVESQKGFSDCVSELILQCGSINVYKLNSATEILD